jgi:hypothetical protein
MMMPVRLTTRVGVLPGNTASDYTDRAVGGGIAHIYQDIRRETRPAAPARPPDYSINAPPML